MQVCDGVPLEKKKEQICDDTERNEIEKMFKWKEHYSRHEEKRTKSQCEGTCFDDEGN